MALTCKRRDEGTDVRITRQRGYVSKVEATSKKGAMWLFENIAGIRVEYSIQSDLALELTDLMNADGLTVELK